MKLTQVYWSVNENEKSFSKRGEFQEKKRDQRVSGGFVFFLVGSEDDEKSLQIGSCYEVENQNLKL
jgi:hypothetical protein